MTKPPGSADTTGVAPPPSDRGPWRVAGTRGFASALLGGGVGVGAMSAQAAAWLLPGVWVFLKNPDPCSPLTATLQAAL